MRVTQLMQLLCANYATAPENSARDESLIKKSVDSRVRGKGSPLLICLYWNCPGEHGKRESKTKVVRVLLGGTGLENCLKRKHKVLSQLSKYTHILLFSEENLYLNVLEDYDKESTANILNEAFPDVVV